MQYNTQARFPTISTAVNTRFTDLDCPDRGSNFDANANLTLAWPVLKKNSSTVSDNTSGAYIRTYFSPQLIHMFFCVWCGHCYGFSCKKCLYLTSFHKITSLLGGDGVMKFTISCLLTLQMLHTQLGKDWLSSSWIEDVNAGRTTHNGRRTTTDDDGRLWTTTDANRVTQVT